MISHIKSIRRRLDSFAHLAKEDLLPTNEVGMCIKELYLAKAWLGKALKEAGAATPYGNDGNRKEVADIEAVADAPDVFDLATLRMDFHNKNPVQKVDWLRQAIEDVKVEVTPFHTDVTEFVMHNIFTHLAEARFWLGFELQRQREEEPTEVRGG